MAHEMSSAARMIFDATAQANETLVSGAQDRRKLEAILMAYDRSLCDPKAVIPTYLHLAIAAARK